MYLREQTLVIAGYFDFRLTCCWTTAGSVNANVEP